MIATELSEHYANHFKRAFNKGYESLRSELSKKDEKVKFLEDAFVKNGDLISRQYADLEASRKENEQLREALRELIILAEYYSDRIGLPEDPEDEEITKAKSLIGPQ